MAQVTIERADHGDVAVVVVRGEVDADTAPQLREALVDAIGEGGGCVVVDLEGVDFIDSVGLGMLVGGLKRARARGGELELVCTGRNVLRVLELTGLTTTFTIHASRESALLRG